MTHDDVVDVLAKAAAYDRRKVGEADVLAWHEIISRWDRADALAAVTRHYTETSDWMMPADLVRHIKALREERRRDRHHGVLSLPSSYEDDPDRDRRIADAKDGPLAEFFRPFAEKRSVDRALREERTTADIEESRNRYLRALEAMSSNETTGLAAEVLRNADRPADGDLGQAAVDYVRSLEKRLAAHDKVRSLEAGLAKRGDAPDPFTEERSTP